MNFLQFNLHLLAYEDLDDIDHYVTFALLNPQAALPLLSDMEESIHQLRQFPFIGADLTDPYLKAKEYRKLIVRNYLIFYLVNQKKKTIIIMRIIYGARNYQNLL